MCRMTIALMRFTSFDGMVLMWFFMGRPISIIVSSKTLLFISISLASS